MENASRQRLQIGLRFRRGKQVGGLELAPEKRVKKEFEAVDRRRMSNMSPGSVGYGWKLSR
jgi:hypothetical protein